MKKVYQCYLKFSLMLIYCPQPEEAMLSRRQLKRAKEVYWTKDRLKVSEIGWDEGTTFRVESISF